MTGICHQRCIFVTWNSHASVSSVAFIKFRGLLPTRTTAQHPQRPPAPSGRGHSAHRDQRASSKQLLFLIWVHTTWPFSCFILLNTVFSKTTAVLLLNLLTWKLWQIPQTSHLPYWGLPWALRKQTKSKPTIKGLFAWHSAALMIFVCEWKTAAFLINNKNILVQKTACLFWKNTLKWELQG